MTFGSTLLPLRPNFSILARRQVQPFICDKNSRLDVVRKRYALLHQEILLLRDAAVLRDIDGVRVKAMYPLIAPRFSMDWKGRNYDHWLTFRRRIGL